MTFTTDRLSTLNLNSIEASTQAVPATVSAFNQLSVDDQLAVLWFAYTEMGRSITPAALGAARLQFAEGILEQIKQMSYDEQLQVMRDLANKVNTPISRSYGLLSTNTKLAFWYQLAEWMGTLVVPVPSGYELSAAASEVLTTIKALDFGQQITILRKAVVDMGVDPLAVDA